jgi:hypothetical protein
MRCVPGNHDVGDGSGEAPLDVRSLSVYRSVFGVDHWAVDVGHWKVIGINAQLLGSGSSQEQALWQWLGRQAGAFDTQTRTALFLHRPLLRRQPGEAARVGRYVPSAACERLLDGPLGRTLRLVCSGHTHQYLDDTVHGVRHLWVPSTAFVFPDDIQSRIGEKVVGVGMLELGDDATRFDLWCPEGMKRHDVTTFEFFKARADSGAAPPAGQCRGPRPG